MSRWLRVLLAGLACYGIAGILSKLEGPHLFWPKDTQQTGIFEAIRVRLGIYNYGEDGKPESNLARLIACPLCVGVYVSALLTILVSKPTTVGDTILTWFGISGFQIYLENQTSDDQVSQAIETVAESLGDNE